MSFFKNIKDNGLAKANSALAAARSRKTSDKFLDPTSENPLLNEENPTDRADCVGRSWQRGR